MAESFTADGTGALTKTDARPRSILVTGAAGNIGAYFAEHAPRNYQLRLMVHHMDDDAEKLKNFGEVVPGDVTDINKMKQFCEGIDTVVHMAGAPNPSSTWDQLLQIDIIGTYNVMVAAKQGKCRRVIYA